MIIGRKFLYSQKSREKMEADLKTSSMNIGDWASTNR